jgi:hypothetical protein
VQSKGYLRQMITTRLERAAGFSIEGVWSAIEKLTDIGPEIVRGRVAGHTLTTVFNRASDIARVFLTRVPKHELLANAK